MSKDPCNAQPGQIWLVEYPYTTAGNMKKVRPALIRQVFEETVLVQKLTTKKKKNKEFSFNKLKKKTYLSSELKHLPYYKLFKYIGTIEKGGDKNER